MGVSVTALLFFVLQLALLTRDRVAANVIGIDFASDAVKVAIVQPGTPLEIVSNFQSKRKTPVSITFYKGERLFGADSTALMARKPSLSFTKLYRTLGRMFEHPRVAELTGQYFPYDIYANETTRATTFKVDEGQAYTSEELVAMFLTHIKDMTANFGGKKIKDCVITVPAFFTQHEKQAVYTAAELADINVLSLMEENTAAALYYGMDRVFEEPKTVLYYNLGAGSCQVTIATYSSYLTKEAGKNKTIGMVEVVGKAWDESLGGHNFDVKLSELLAARFTEVWQTKKGGVGKDLRDYSGPMTRLRLQATKVKEILSANTEFPVRAEQLHEDIDLNTKVTRAEFEEACEELFSKVTGPIDQALARANLTLADISDVEMLGGGVRMPRIKKMLEDYFTTSEKTIVVGQHMNGDESMALGAAFRAANISTAFRVRKVGLSDISTFGVSVKLTSLPVEEKSGGLLGGFLGGKKEKPADEEEWSKFTGLYPSQTAFPAKAKTLSFQYDKDIFCRIEYDDNVELPEGTDPLIAVFNVTGIAAFTEEAKTKGANATKVAMTFSMDASGMITLTKAEATAELPMEPEPEEEAAVATEDEKTETETEAGEDAAAEEDTAEAEAASENATESSTTDTKKTEKKVEKKDEKKKKRKAEVLRRSLTIDLNRQMSSPPVWTPAQIAESKAKLRLLQDSDDARQEKEAAMNELEGWLYKAKNKIMDEEDNLKAVSTEEQRQEIVDMANEIEDWLYGDGRDVETTVYRQKQTGLTQLFNKLIHRYEEVEARESKISTARAFISKVTTAVADWEVKKPYITEEERAELLETVSKAEVWLDEKVEAQAAMSPYELPAFDSADVPRQMKVLHSHYDRISKKPKPKPEPKNETNTTIVDETNGTEGDAEAADGEEVVQEEEAVKVEVEEKTEAETSDDAEL